MLNPVQNRLSALSFMNGTVTAIIEFSQTFYLFDSHCRNGQGLADKDGFLALLKFSRLEHVQNYIKVIHLEYKVGKGSTSCYWF